jgi:hypothetical protein
MAEAKDVDKARGAAGSVSPSPRPEEALIRAALPPKPEGCKQPLLVKTGLGLWWRPCGRASCCRRCRDWWGRKRARCVSRSFADLPPTHFATILPRAGMTNVLFAAALGKLLLALKRRILGLSYLVVREWVNGVMHAHGLLRAVRMTRRQVREAKAVASVRVRVKPVRNPIGAAVYVFKAGEKRKAELPPPGYRGRLLLTSRDFLTASFAKLWRIVCTERAEGRAKP